MIRKKVFFLIIATIIIACNDKNVNYDASIIEKAKVRSLQTELIKNDIDCTYPIKLIKRDSVYLIQNLGSDNVITLLNEKGEYQKCIVKRGDAPNEINNISSTISMDDTLVTLYSNPYFVEYNIDKILKSEGNYWKKVKMDVSTLKMPISNVRKIKGNYLYEGFTPEMRFAISNKDGSYLTYNEYPQIVDRPAKEIAAVMSYASKMYVHPEQNLWIQVNYIGAVMEIFKEENGKIISVKQLFIYPPVYEGSGSQITWGDDSIIGFDDITITSNHIYALLNGRKGKELKSMPPITPFGDRIIKMDWEGNIIEIIKADCMIVAFDVDEVNKEFHLISYNKEDGFDLKKIKL